MSNHDGTQVWVPPGIFTVSCKLDIYWFPFDEQTCFFKVRWVSNGKKEYGSLQFGSWTFDDSKLDLQPGEFDMTDFVENGEWIISCE